MRRRLVRLIALGVPAVLLLVVGRPAAHLAATMLRDRAAAPEVPAGMVDDASRLNLTAVAEVVPLAGADGAAAERQIAALLARARAAGQHVAIAGARHTMGGHTIYPGGIALDMRGFNGMSLDEEAGILRVGSGALWSQVIPFLDERGWSVAVMQSNSSFTVGGSISANCHGWQIGRPPIASTVHSFRLMTADGAVHRCSRSADAELFALALGGYGLFGVILDVELEVVPNQRYVAARHHLDAAGLPQAFGEYALDQPGVVMAFARLSVVPDAFLEDAILTVFWRDPAPDGSLPPLAEPGLEGLQRAVFRGSAGSDYGKTLRWNAEPALGQHLAGRHFSRNQLLNEGVELFQDRSEATTDILHEYFVAPEAFEPFLADARKIIRAHGGDLLNATVRHVIADPDTLLRYADGELLSIVMLFSQKRSPEAEGAMEVMTRELIDAALAQGGRHYLPYRLHATPEQLRRAYPQADRFFELKRRYDPDGLFQNEFSLRYGGE